eukprot:152377-Pleurochrysis_carterae.AAC.1
MLGNVSVRIETLLKLNASAPNWRWACVWVGVCVRACGRVRVRASVRACARACVRACVRAGVRACVWSESSTCARVGMHAHSTRVHARMLAGVRACESARVHERLLVQGCERVSAPACECASV